MFQNDRCREIAQDRGCGPCRKPGELKTLLGVPDEYAFAAMIPMGKPVKQLTRLTRKPVEEFATLESFDGPALGT